MLNVSDQEGSMWAAALATAFCGLMRGGEIAAQDGVEFDPTLNLTRADVDFYRDEHGTLIMVLMMRPAKKGPAQKKSVPLLIAEGGKLIDPVRLMQRMLELDPVPEGQKATTPLFRRASGKTIQVREVRDMVKLLMGKLGLDRGRFGAHSLRIGGATAALAAGMSAAAIRAAGRWSSDVYQLYCRLSKQSAAGVATAIGSTPFEDLERGVQFAGDEMMLTAAEMPVVRLSSFIERDLVEDALADEDEA
jgi:hypothetical protein